jgi:hypothetical protein
MDAAIKILQTVRFALMLSVVLYVFVGETVAPNARTAPNSAFYFAITLVAIVMVGMIVVTRRLLVRRSEELLAAEPSDSAALMRWRAGYIVTYAMSEALALLGFVLRILGFTLSQVAPFYIAGFALMLFFGPRRPFNEIG